MAGEGLLQRIVALNAQRHAEEQSGEIRWLRPAYQRPGAAAVQVGLGLEGDQAASGAGRAKKTGWPAGLADQVRAVKDALRASEMLTSDVIANRFTRARRTRVDEILETLTALGQVREVEGKYLL